MNTGKPVLLERLGVCALLGVLTTAYGGSAPVPEGFTARVYARNLAGARELHVDADGTLRVRGNEAAFEIKPPRWSRRQ